MARSATIAGWSLLKYVFAAKSMRVCTAITCRQPSGGVSRGLILRSLDSLGIFFSDILSPRITTNKDAP